ncbi:hypothetical protein SCLCIDRAFT_1134125 [Scleroderma citrinum Foug A]|uniref:Uncharacterized protein n=1 Tax=Scleroderma citrinum Foug A TaxID=1036808 RepID=A0A0C2Z5V4_9AGAM|nr:hypothetical protein SCLCIDRAFT_1134125 [Scleroderma citrinum Foug A]
MLVDAISTVNNNLPASNAISHGGDNCQRRLRCILMFSLFSAASLAFPMLWASMHMVNVTAWLPRPSAMPVHHFSALAAVSLSFPKPCTSMRMLNTSAWFSSPFYCSAHSLALPEGEFGSFSLF